MMRIRLIAPTPADQLGLERGAVFSAIGLVAIGEFGSCCVQRAGLGHVKRRKHAILAIPILTPDQNYRIALGERLFDMSRGSFLWGAHAAPTFRSCSLTT
jgi:hypothetical protein